ncbi:hypothetical protein TIFTF001_006827 [Ficus carica]|uniref:Uncharacterized protein n=1 Tax=Ficus carica TaxID=3494 RepID=A0AA87ZPR4_FICCA|nr:hypothetical protein TIFTF001_006827 [Ficus carica]
MFIIGACRSSPSLWHTPRSHAASSLNGMMPIADPILCHLSSPLPTDLRCHPISISPDQPRAPLPTLEKPGHCALPLQNQDTKPPST